MYTEEERAKWRELVARWKAGEKVFDAGKRVEKTDATTVQRQEPVQLIKRQISKSPVVPENWIEKQQQPAVKQGNTYKVKPRPQTFAGRVAQVAGKDWIKTDAASASAGMALAQVPVIGPVLSAAWGAPDFGYDLNESIHNITDQEAHKNTAMSGLALLPFTRNGLKMLKGKTYVDRLRNMYDSWMTKYNTSREVNKALKAARISDATEDGTRGIFDQYAKEWFNNETSFFGPLRSSGGKANTVGDVIDFNLGMYGGRDKLLSEITPNQQWRLIKSLTMSEGKNSPKMRMVVHMDDSGPQPVNKTGFVPKDKTNSNSPWNSSLDGEPEIWWNRAEPYYSGLGYSSIQNIPRTIIADIDDLSNAGITLKGRDVLHGTGVVPFEKIEYGIQPNLFGWFDRIKFVGQ